MRIVSKNCQIWLFFAALSTAFRWSSPFPRWLGAGTISASVCVTAAVFTFDRSSRVLHAATSTSASTISGEIYSDQDELLDGAIAAVFLQFEEADDSYVV